MRSSLLIAIAIVMVGACSHAAINIPMDAQINVGRITAQSLTGDALYIPDFSTDTLEFRADEAEGYARHYMDGSGAGSWAYGPYVDFYLSGDTDDYINVAGQTLTFETRVYQDAVSNTNPYGDANVFVRLYQYDDDGTGTYPTYVANRDFGIVYGPNLLPGGDDVPYPTWTTVTVDLDGGTDSAGFDPAKVNRMRFYGTDWAGGGDDFADFKNFQIVPEPATMTLLGLAGLALLRRRK